MGRRGHGEGSIYRRKDGRWAAQIDLGRGPDGRRLRRTIYGKTRREVAAKLRQELQKRDEGQILTPERLTLDQFCQRWLTDRVRPTVEDSTYRSYEGILRLHLLPALGEMPLSKLHAMHLQKLYVDKLSEGLSGRTVQYLHQVTRRALAQAVRWGLIPRNPADFAEPPKAEQSQMRFLSPDEAQRLLAAAQGHRLYALFVLAVTTGMRRGELFGLRWSDVDLQAGKIRVTQAMRYASGKAEVAAPKTRSARRTITLTQMAVQALKRHLIQQKAERLQAGPLWRGDEYDLVFCTQIGTPLGVRNVMRRDFKPLLEAAGLGDIRFHDLRHTAATLMLSQGVHPKVVSEMLGHSRTAITMDVYSHALPNLQAEAAQKMDALLGGDA